MQTKTVQASKVLRGSVAEKQKVEQPKRLSKAAIWRQNNPNGIFVIVDRKAVMK
jgi:hypothetical protein